MATPYTESREPAVSGKPVVDGSGDPLLDERPAERRVDSNAVRWVFVATVAFWLIVYAAGRTVF